MKINVVSAGTVAMEDKPPTTRCHHDDNDNEGRTSLRQLLRPALVMMTICGCYTYETKNVKSGPRASGCRLYPLLGTVYRVFCMCLCLTSLIKTLAAFSNIPASFVQLNVCLCTWFTNCIVILLISLKSTHAKWQSRAFDFWDDEIMPELSALGIQLPLEEFKKRQKIYIFIAVALSLTNISTIILFSADAFSNGYDIFYAAPFTPSGPIVILITSYITEASFLWIMPVFYIMTVSKLLTIAFESSNKNLAHLISQNTVNIREKCHRIRILHLNLSKMVFYMDKDFGYYFAAIFVCSIGISCFILYQGLRSELDTLTLVIFLFWVTALLCLLAAAAISAAIVNDVAHGALDSIYYLCVNNISTEQLGQLNLFLSKLTGTQIGFTTLGLLTITKEFLLTIAGVFMTYFFLLYTL